MKAKEKEFNPFPTIKYLGPKYFCDRDEELSQLRSTVKNDRPVTIFSKRRMGKTGLIKHLQYYLTRSRKYICIYVDIFDTTSDRMFVEKLVNASIAALDGSKKKFGTEILQVFKKFSPKVSLDPLSGAPVLEFNIRTESEIKMSLSTLFNLLESQKKRIQISIDEFQQLANYRTTSMMTATLREYMQNSKNVHFLFSGSQRHLLLNLFNNPKEPLYRMVDQIMLHEVGFSAYQEFIKLKFKEAGRSIDDKVVHDILHWTRQHTFYVQVVCNKLFSIPKKKINNMDLLRVQHIIIKELEMNFLGYRQLLSTNQFKVLQGIAKEGSIKSIQTKHFTQLYNVAASTAKQSLDYLVDKELVYENLTKEGSTYIVYDLFFDRWLKIL